MRKKVIKFYVDTEIRFFLGVMANVKVKKKRSY